MPLLSAHISQRLFNISVFIPLTTNFAVFVIFFVRSLFIESSDRHLFYRRKNTLLRGSSRRSWKRFARIDRASAYS